MRLAVFSSNVEASNGWGNFTLNLCRCFINKGIKLTIILPEGANLDHVAAFGLTDYIRTEKSSNSYWRNYDHVDLDGTYDAVMSMTAQAQSVQAMRTAKKYDLPFILGVHGTFGVMPFFSHMINKFFFLKMMRAADLIWSPSSYTRSTVANMMEMTTNDYRFRERMHVIHCGVEFDFYNQKYKKRDNSLNLVSVGHVKKRKGIHFTLKALSILKQRTSDFKYTIVGPCRDAAYLADLKQMIADLDLGQHVHFTGEVSREVLPDTIAAHNIYVHTPSTYGWNFEGFGIVYLEANAMGLPVIGSNSGGVTSAVWHNHNGLLVEEENVEMIAQRLTQLAEDNDLYQTLSENGVAWARQHDWNTIADQHLALYKDMLDNKTK